MAAGDDVGMQEQRAQTYARCTAEVDADHSTAGAEAIFDQALTKALSRWLTG
jgi:hypothetical protein